MNALRIHVHVENYEFYDLCDRLGIVLLQDSDMNWMFPTDEQFTQRALTVAGGMVKKLRNHPSIICWTAINEAQQKYEAMTRPGPQLVAEMKRLDPTRPIIRNSDYKNDLESGGEVTRGQAAVRLGPDSYARVGNLSFEVKKGVAYRVALVLRASDGREVARNVYQDPFNHPPLPEGYPRRMDPDMGMRLWWAK